MNKQEFQQTIKNMKCKKDCVYMSSFSVYQKGFEKAKELALLHSNSLDEPEKPVLTKAEAEWVEGLKEEQERRPFWTKYSALYFITRCGFGYGFSYDHNGREIELKHYPHETHVEKERLANAILYGYEIEKEKLYRAKNKQTGEYLCYCFEFFHDKNSSSEDQRFTAEEKRWKELGYWGNDLYVFEEAEGEDE